MKKVLLAMSGGVDSSAAAILLLQAGYEVAGATFMAFDPPGGLTGDGVTREAHDARLVCEKLGISHHFFDFREAFQREVMDDFAAEYRAGRTPNPCVRCNKTIKFGAFLREAEKLGFDLVATGHYAGVLRGENGRFLIRRAADERKDQSYMLWSLSQEQLRHLILPLEKLTKAETRAIAAEHGLATASKSDSQDICFIPDGDYIGYLERYYGRACEPGDFIDRTGRKLGQHRGIWHYTIGQRKGLGVTFGRPMFVCGIDAESRAVVLGESEELFCDSLTAKAVNFMAAEPTDGPLAVTAKVRYAHKGTAATVSLLGGGRVEVRFAEPVRAVTPGQSVVFYDGDAVVGGAVIE